MGIGGGGVAVSEAMSVRKLASPGSSGSVSSRRSKVAITTDMGAKRWQSFVPIVMSVALALQRHQSAAPSLHSETLGSQEPPSLASAGHAGVVATMSVGDEPFSRIVSFVSTGAPAFTL